MKLEEGMYARTKKGIAKVLGRVKDPTNYYYKMLITDRYLEINDDTEYIHELDIIKFSKSIIDLIEEGDYVNGYSVIEKPYSYLGIQFISLDTHTSWGWGKGEIPAENIKSIVTKEQFESMKYEVK